jgi:peptide/nickel transport system permease protein
LAGAASTLAVALAIPLAVLSARRPGWVDQSITMLCTALASLPSFWFALALVFVFAARVSWLPTGGYGGARELILPAIALAAVPLGHLTLLLASTMRAEFGAQYIAVARAKGLGEWKLSLRHVLPNASLVLATQVGFLVATLLSGTVLIETVFAWPGLGQLGLEAVQQRDLPLVMATVIYIGTIVIVINLIVDLAYARLDPRVRLA